MTLTQYTDYYYKVDVRDNGYLTGTTGQLGNGGTSTTVVPAKVKDQTGKGTLKGIIDVQCGMRWSMALAEDGNVWTWGYNVDGELGNGTTDQINLPKLSKLSNIDKLATSAYATMAIDKDGHGAGMPMDNYQMELRRIDLLQSKQN